MSQLESAPRHPAATGKGLEAWQNKDDISVSFQDYKIKPLSPRSKPNEPMKHAGQVIPIVLLNLIIAALASESTSPDVKRYLLGVLS